MTVQPLEDVLSDMEFEKGCIFDGCDHAAEWLVWVSHADGDPHHEDWWHLCLPHRQWAEAQSLLRVGPGLPCCCGKFTFTGQLSDHFRAIRL